MNENMWAYLVDELRETGIEFSAGLTDAEVADIETCFGFRFPPDLRLFLGVALPRGDRFPDWRSGNETTLREWLDLPMRGVLFDVEHNGFWLEEWGPRPLSREDAQALARQFIAVAPQLIPIYAHRMMPTEPHLPGNPVFSVHQTDIIYYGIDLRDYLIHEFLTRYGVGVWPIPDNIRKIPFWDVERFQSIRWGPDGSCKFDNSQGQSP